MNRPNEFSLFTKQSARLRQSGLCACCGESLDDLWEEAHHLQPVLIGGPAVIDNCVILCDACHSRVHADGLYRSGIVAPRSYFPYLDGK